MSITKPDMKELRCFLLMMDTNAMKYLRVYSFLLMGDIQSSKNFVILHVEEPILDEMCLCFGRP